MGGGGWLWVSPVLPQMSVKVKMGRERQGKAEERNYTGCLSKWHKAEKNIHPSIITPLFVHSLSHFLSLSPSLFSLSQAGTSVASRNIPLVMLDVWKSRGLTG